MIHMEADANDEEAVILYDVDESGYSEDDERALWGCQVLATYAPIWWSILCLICCSLLYYQLMMKRPLTVLNDAFYCVMNGDLEFSISCEGRNELASVCRAMELMRRSLAENTQEMLAMSEQRKRINDAYTHEMRTPVAVLRSNAEMIAEYYPKGKMAQEELMSTIGIMRQHIARIEAFIESMNQIQKLEDLPIRKEEIDVEGFIKILASSAEALCSGRNLQMDFKKNLTEKRLLLDSSVIQQVFENLLTNALRYANQQIEITCSDENGLFKITVKDDGNGFSETELKQASRCYYSGRTTEGNYHFGLGLYICTMLCERHGGSLDIENAPEGGACITANFEGGIFRKDFEN